MAYPRVTVLGASGFVGRYVVKRLAGEGCVITAVSRHAGAADFLKPMGDVGQIALIDADVRDAAALRAVLAGAEIVVNAVGILYERGAARFETLHHRLPERVGALARAAGVRQVVHFSALGADAHSPAAYGRSKAAGEAALRAGFPAAIVLRPSIVFGPEDSFFNRFAGMARVAPALPLIGGGVTRFQPVYVGDVADAAVAALALPGDGPRLFELAGPAVFTFKELMTLLLRTIRRRRMLIPVPFGLAMLQASLLQLLPDPPLTRDQVRMLRRDNVAAPGVPGLTELGLSPTALELILPTYLGRFRSGPREARILTA